MGGHYNTDDVCVHYYNNNSNDSNNNNNNNIGRSDVIIFKILLPLSSSSVTPSGRRNLGEFARETLYYCTVSPITPH